MSKDLDSKNGSDISIVYQIKVKGHFDREWMSWFGAIDIILADNGDTFFIIKLVDQSALHGLLKKVRDSGMTLISVNPARPGQSDTPDV